MERQMAEAERPQIYLLTPPAFELSTFAPHLSAVLDAHPVACIRLALATRDEDTLARAADSLREISHARDTALVISPLLVMNGRLMVAK